MDILSDTLGAMGLRGSLTFDAALKAPWGFEAPERKGLSPFYVVASGSCVAEVIGPHGRLVRRPASGDLVMFPQGKAHILRDAPESPVMPISALEGGTARGFALRSAAAGPMTSLVAGEFRFESPLSPSILEAMDPIVCVKPGADDSFGTLDPILHLLCREERSTLPGSRAATTDLLSLLFLHVLRSEMARRKLEGEPCSGNSFALMFEPALRGAVEALHRHPDRPWTVAALAAEAGMSRTSFTVRFSETAGMSPFAYLTRLRMMKAIELLEGGSATLEKIAEQVGYGSEAAFSTAFKREMRMAPGVYRRSRERRPRSPRPRRGRADSF